MEDLRELAERRSLENNRVIVRLWISTHKDKEFESIGHISVEVEGGYYISLWPKGKVLEPDPAQPKETDPYLAEAPTAPHVGLLDKNREFPFYLVRDITEDCHKKREGRPPDRVYCFYKLTVLGINDKFEEIKKNLEKKPEGGWTLIPGKETPNAESCISLVCKVLEAGDFFEKYVSHPDKVKELIKGSSKASSGSSTAAMFSSANASSSNKNRAKHYLGETKVQFVKAVENLLAVLIGVESPDAWENILEMARTAEREDRLVKKMFFEGETFPPYKQPGPEDTVKNDSGKGLRNK